MPESCACAGHALPDHWKHTCVESQQFKPLVTGAHHRWQSLSDWQACAHAAPSRPTAPPSLPPELLPPELLPLLPPELLPPELPLLPLLPLLLDASGTSPPGPSPLGEVEPQP